MEARVRLRGVRRVRLARRRLPAYVHAPLRAMHEERGGSRISHAKRKLPMTNKFLMLVEVETDHPNVDASRTDFIRSGVRRVLTWAAFEVWSGTLFKPSSVRVMHCQAIAKDEDGSPPPGYVPPLLGNRAIAWRIANAWSGSHYDQGFDQHHSCCSECRGWRPGGSTRRKNAAECFGHTKRCALAAMIAEAKAQPLAPAAAE